MEKINNRVSVNPCWCDGGEGTCQHLQGNVQRVSNTFPQKEKKKIGNPEFLLRDYKMSLSSLFKKKITKPNNNTKYKLSATVRHTRRKLLYSAF